MNPTLTMVCVECSAIADEEARGWRAYRAHLTAEAEAEDTSAGDVRSSASVRPP